MAIVETPRLSAIERRAARGIHRASWMWLVIVAVHVLLVFAVMPVITGNLGGLYSQNQFDIDGYNLLAKNLAAGHGYRFFEDTAPTLMREPGFPVLFAGIIRLFGESMVSVQVMNLFFIIFSAILLGLLVQRLTKSKSAITIALAVFLFHPGTLIAESRAGVEAVLIFLFAASILLIHRAMRTDRWQEHFIAGLVLGCAVLVRSTPILFPIILLGYRLIFDRRGADFKVMCRNAVVMTAAMFISVSPWIVRNFRVTRHFMPTASVLGVSAHAGQYICEHIGENRPWYLLDREASRERGALASELGYKTKEGEIYYQFFYRTQDELDFSNYLARAVARKYVSSPGLCVRCMSENLVNFWIAGKTWKSRLLDSVIQVPFVALAIWGLMVCWRRDRKLAGLAALFIVYLMMVSMPILAQARYSVPLIPLMAAAIAVALVSKWELSTRPEEQV